MRVFTCTDGTGHWPVGFAAVVVAETEDDARAQLNELMRADGLQATGDETLVPIDTGHVGGVLLVNGDY